MRTKNNKLFKHTVSLLFSLSKSIPTPKLREQKFRKSENNVGNGNLRHDIKFQCA